MSGLSAAGVRIVTKIVMTVTKNVRIVTQNVRIVTQNVRIVSGSVSLTKLERMSGTLVDPFRDR